MADQLSQDLASLKIDRTPKPRGRGLGTIVTLLILGAVGVVGYLVVYPRVMAALNTPELKTAEIALISPAQARSS